MHKPNKQDKLAALRKFVASGKFASQEDLLSALTKQGYELTQATLSRDLAKLGAVKKDGKYSMAPVGSGLDGSIKVESIKYVRPNMIVLKTTPGLAQTAAFMIDKALMEGIAGTLAGDDTLFVVIDPPHLHGRIIKSLTSLFSTVYAR